MSVTDDLLENARRVAQEMTPLPTGILRRSYGALGVALALGALELVTRTDVLPAR